MKKFYKINNAFSNMSAFIVIGLFAAFSILSIAMVFSMRTNPHQRAYNNVRANVDDKPSSKQITAAHQIQPPQTVEPIKTANIEPQVQEVQPVRVSKHMERTGTVVTIPCQLAYEDKPYCKAGVFKVDTKDMITGEYLDTDNRGESVNFLMASADGQEMSWGLAKKSCEAIGMRLPSEKDLSSIKSAGEKNVITPLMNNKMYWSSELKMKNNKQYALDCTDSGGTFACMPVNVMTTARVRCAAD